jgi:hypothetical protein
MSSLPSFNKHGVAQLPAVMVGQLALRHVLYDIETCTNERETTRSRLNQFFSKTGGLLDQAGGATAPPAARRPQALICEGI